MNNQISYGKLLLYNFLLGSIGFVVALIGTFPFIIKLFSEISELFVTSIDSDLSFFYFYGYLFGYGGVILVLFFIITKLFTSGLSYVPYLYKTNQLSFSSILKLGFKKFIPVIISYIAVGFVIGIVSSALSVIPLVSIFTYIITPYLFGLGIFLVDYHLSRNALHGQKATASIDKNIMQLLKNKNTERGVYIVPIFYMLVSFTGLGNLFIKPLIHLKIIDILNDEERFVQPPPYPEQPYHYPPQQPPQQLG